MDILNLDTWLAGFPRLGDGFSPYDYWYTFALTLPGDAYVGHLLLQAFHDMLAVSITPNRQVWTRPTPLTGFVTSFKLMAVDAPTHRHEITFHVIPV